MGWTGKMCNAYKIRIIALHTIQYCTQLHSKVCVCAANTKPLQNKYTQQNVDFANSLTIQYHGTRRCMELCMMKTITAMLIMTFTQKNNISGYMPLQKLLAKWKYFFTQKHNFNHFLSEGQHFLVEYSKLLFTGQVQVYCINLVLTKLTQILNF